MAVRLFADVILPLPIPNLLTYEVEENLAGEIAVGKRVIVQLGKQKFYSAIVRKLHNQAPVAYEVKGIQSVLDEQPVVSELHLKFWEWIAGYYLCHLGEAMNAALPAALKLQSESKIILNPEYHHNHEELSSKEYLIYEALLISHELTVTEVAKLLQRKSAHGIIKEMIERGVVLMAEELNDRYKPKKVVQLSLHEKFRDEALLHDIFQQLEKRSPKQLEALMIFMKQLFDQKEREFVPKSDLINNEKVSAAAIAALIKKEILVERAVLVDRLISGNTLKTGPVVLSDAQNICLNEVNKHFEKEDVVLLYGVTSSGKTEIYIHLIEEAIKKGKQVLYLLPEIALTAQMINRLKKHFGNSVGIYHSRQNSNERVEVWKAVKRFNPDHKGEQPAQVVLGARSALFLPYSDLGLVIVDEEHDSSYKQNDPAPRYHGRDAALVLAKMFSAKTLLGSATPSMESFFNVKEKKYGIVNLAERFGGMEMPVIKVCDVRESTRKKIMKSHFTPELIEAIGNALTNKEQVILFQNRRGFAPVLECNNCAWIPECKNCTVTLTYHKQLGQLKCHYCGYSANPPATCQRCGDHHLQVKGFGTEKIEEEMAIFFPDAVIARLDLDSTRSRNAYHKIISDFEERKIDMLVGTQMVTKGLDFENVSTVGIINADQLLNFPDFRAHERAYQLMSQVSGRSGRKLKRGLVLIQTHQPDHWVIQLVMKHNYEAFYTRELFERKKFDYPPHRRLIEIVMKHRDPDILHEKSIELGDILRKKLGNRVIGPHQPLIARIKNLWLKRILIKIEKEASVGKVKNIYRQQVAEFYKDKNNQSVSIVVDVDPS
ncbi:MAG: primosomal protein N' [Bacteroidetes bacterium]|nr:primosomal protein N' [Bacteroidota bacterium]